MQSKIWFNSKCSSNPRMNSLLYRSTCNNSGIESADTCWSLQNHQRSCRSTTELMFDSSNDIWNMSSRSVKGDTFCSSRFVFNFVLFLCLSSRVVPGFVVCKSISNNVPRFSFFNISFLFCFISNAVADCCGLFHQRHGWEFRTDVQRSMPAARRQRQFISGCGGGNGS